MNPPKKPGLPESPAPTPIAPANSDANPGKPPAAKAGAQKVCDSPKQAPAPKPAPLEPNMPVAFATCDRCRPHGRGCFREIPSTSPMPKGKDKDPHLHIGRSALYILINEKKLDYYGVGSTLLDGASKCHYLESTKNIPAGKRGGDRRKKKSKAARPAPVGPAVRTLTPPPAPLQVQGPAQTTSIAIGSKPASMGQAPKPLIVLPPPTPHV